ncbi:MAG: hypothetical protein J2P50_06865 [Hyphomicrobiaceae bacterium]|nr:hypothetical protein [Hyphomicrobiaceae bacterium]
MTTLSRQPDGSYHGSYKGREFTVREEQVEERITTTYARAATHWVARCGTIEYRSRIRPNRDDAVQGLLRELDKADAIVPELDALLTRWAEEIKAIVPLLNDSDAVARAQLEDLRFQLGRLDADVRLRAVRFEEKLSSLKARMQHPAGSVPHPVTRW